MRLTGAQFARFAAPDSSLAAPWGGAAAGAAPFAVGSCP